MKKGFKSIVLKIFSLKLYLWLCKHIGKVGDEGYIQINKQFFFQLLSKQSKQVQFIQIGANDGITNDPIHPYIKKYKWAGILVEPLPDFFQKLQLNYSEEMQLNFENVGIGNENGNLSFYYLPVEYNQPQWLQQIGTFSKEAIELNLKHLPQYLNVVAVKEIPVITLNALMARSNIKALDLLVIDAEGFEYQILSQLNNCTVKPKYIFYEWGCMPEHENKSLQETLKKMGYYFFASSGDLLAVKK